MYYNRVGKTIFFTIFAALLTSVSCTEYYPYDTRISGKQNINATNASLIKSRCRGRNTIRFAVISDTQRHYDETCDAVDALNLRNDIDFVVHAGDIADFGLRAEFERQRNILERLDVPYIVTLGNHDCLATGKIIFEKIFGPFDFAFDAGSVRLLVLNTNALEFSSEQSVPNLDFLDENLPPTNNRITKSVAIMHCRPYSDQFDNHLTEAFHAKLCQYPSLQFCINGHQHTFEQNDIFGDGIIYYQCDNIEHRTYLLFEITEEGYSYEHIEF